MTSIDTPLHFLARGPATAGIQLPVFAIVLAAGISMDSVSADAADATVSPYACTDEIIKTLADASEEAMPKVDPKYRAKLNELLNNVRTSKDAGNLKKCRTDILLDVIVLEKLLGRRIR